MSNTFLLTFMQVVQEITGAQRCMALDTEQTIRERMNMDEAYVASQAFRSLADEAVQEANEKNTVIITNNLSRDPNFAPKTNVHLTDLRVAAAIPLKDFGTIYMEQHIRHGVFERHVIERLHSLGLEIVQSGQLEISAADIKKRYEQD